MYDCQHQPMLFCLWWNTQRIEVLSHCTKGKYIQTSAESVKPLTIRILMTFFLGIDNTFCTYNCKPKESWKLKYKYLTKQEDMGKDSKLPLLGLKWPHIKC